MADSNMTNVTFLRTAAEREPSPAMICGGMRVVEILDRLAEDDEPDNEPGPNQRNYVADAMRGLSAEELKGFCRVLMEVLVRSEASTLQIGWIECFAQYGATEARRVWEEVNRS